MTHPSSLKTLVNRLPVLFRRNWLLDGYRAAIDTIHLIQDKRQSTFITQTPFDSTQLLRYFSPAPLSVLKQNKNWIVQVSDHYLAHRFDLLGSGWVNVKHGLLCQGVEEYRYSPNMLSSPLENRINSQNLPESQRILSAIDPGYQLIDWQLDFKSGYRWSEKTWSKRIRYGHQPGADIKVPWELARMQHLPTLVWAYSLASADEDDLKPAEIYVREFQNQILDFIANNPPRFGVNWVCSMDVAIRASNWLAAYDLFRAHGVEFPERFTRELIRNIYELGLHIAQHLEWNPVLRGNHYLANIAGLIFISAYLPCNDETNAWLHFAIQELLDEFQNQFHQDGSNFEASTCYHRLSGEMMAYAAAIVIALPQEKREALTKIPSPHTISTYKGFKFRELTLHPLPGCPEKATPLPSWFFDRLNTLTEFSAILTAPDGLIPQIGDNDNGRLFKFHPALERNISNKNELSENILNHHHLISACNAILSRKDLLDFSRQDWIDFYVLKGIAGELRLRYQGQTKNISRSVSNSDQRFNLLDCTSIHTFPDFGLYLFRSSDLYLLFRCGIIGQNGNGGHAHNDQLSFVLSLFSVPVFTDPGTYLYTPIPSQRNRFRSTAAHNTLSLPGREQYAWPDPSHGLFCLIGDAKPQVNEIRAHGISAAHQGFGYSHRRSIDIHTDKITGVDECHAPDKTISFHLAHGLEAKLENDGTIHVQLPSVNRTIVLSANTDKRSIETGWYSAAYGSIRETRILRLRGESERIEWSIGITNT